MSLSIKEIGIDKSAAIEHLLTRVLKDAFEYLMPQLTHMFNCSLKNSSPDDWKRATVLPLQKSGNTSNVSNLGPVSPLHLPGKLLKRFFIIKFLAILNKLINDDQNSFRRGRFTIGTVAELTNDILLGINDRNFTIAAFIDVRKVFNTVSHEILGGKLHKFGFHKNIIALSNRKQRCKVDGITSVPQGSILGPMLFLLYINYINTMLNQTKLYADDTVIYATHIKEKACYEWLCADLEVLMGWFN